MFVFLSLLLCLTLIQTVSFPKQFSISMGLTLPLRHRDIESSHPEPVAQTGQLYFDLIHQRLRLDTQWKSSHRRLVIDFNKGNAFFTNGEPSSWCIASRVSGRLLRIRIPDSVTGNTDDDTNRSSSTTSVYQRGVLVRRFSWMEEGESFGDDERLVHLSVLRVSTKMNKTDAFTQISHHLLLPWQYTLVQLPPGSSSRDTPPLPPTKPTPPNWRLLSDVPFPVAELSEEERAYRRAQSQLEQMAKGLKLTVDFYNAMPSEPDSTLFDSPPGCFEEGVRDERQVARRVNVFELIRQVSALTLNTEEGRVMLREWFDKLNQKTLGERSTLEEDF